MLCSVDLAAWLWPYAETRRKCGRTFATAVCSGRPTWFLSVLLLTRDPAMYVTRYRR